MEIISINLGKAKPISAKSGISGIYKDPITNAVYITQFGLAGDVIVDTENHGGVDQAVYIYGVPDYAWWSQELGGREMQPGLFGENLTLSELESASLNIGDRLHSNDVILEVTAPRIPCVTLATRMNDPQFVKRFIQAGRYGAYCRVIRTGTITAGSPITLEPYPDTRVSINEMAEVFYRRQIDKPQLQRLLSVPVAIRARKFYEEKLLEQG